MKNPDDDVLREGLAQIRDLAVYDPPASVWRGIEHELDRRSDRRPVAVAAAARRVAAVALIAVIGALAVSGLLGVYRSSWAIQRLAGTPTAGARSIATDGTLAEGEWLETDAASRARLSIGTLGQADVGPGSRVQLVRAGGAARALRVERGSIDARVWAPPRFFLVETPAATAVDLGCVYSLEVDENGNGVLVVRSGQVELTGHGRGSLVVAGTAAAMRRGAGPGTPYSTRESDAFRDALGVIDFGGGPRADAMHRLVALATIRSTITLWHLLPRVSAAERAIVYDRLASLFAPPPGVRRDAVLALDAGAISRWRSSLEPSWSVERVRLWKRAWRALWSIARDG